MKEAISLNYMDDILNNISVIIQGKVMGAPGEPVEKQLTLQCIKSIKEFIPNAEVIISTWEGSDVSHLTYDKVIFNQDPGAMAYYDLNPNFLNNNNRQIVSTYNGFKAAIRKYAIKMRGDCKFTSTGFLDYYLKEYPRSEKLRFFKQRVLIPTKYSRNPRRIAQLIHPSDIFQFGLREDLLNLWDIQLQPEPQTTRAIPYEKKVFNNALRGGFHRMKFGSEQYIWYAFCKKMGLDMELKHYSHIPVDSILNSDMSIVNNFIIAEAKDFGVELPKRMYLEHDRDLYNYDEWLKLSKRYASGKALSLYELALITQVYTSNVLHITNRIYHKLFKYGVGDFFKAFQQYTTGKPSL